MPSVARKAVKAIRGRRHHSYAFLFSQIQQVAHAAIGAITAGMQLHDGLRTLAQQDGHRVESKHSA